MLFVLALCLASGVANGQSDPQFGKDDFRYWIFFSDEERLADEDGELAGSAFVTERARWRRAVRGTAQPGPSDRQISLQYRAELERLGAVIVTESRWLNAVSAVVDEGQIERILALPFVTEVRPVAVSAPNYAREPFAPLRESILDVDLGPSRTQLELINAHTALARGYTGRGVILGFLDTLYDFSHPAFERLVEEDRLIAVKDFTGLTQSNYHGLSVSSVAAGYAPGQLIGPASGAAILAATTEYVPTETRQEEDFFVAGLEWLERMGADVVNISLGYTTFDEGEGDYTYEDMDGRTAIPTLAVNRAATLGVTVVTSAGNSGWCASPDHCWYYIGSPADSDSVITVGAVGRDSVRASFSSYGPTSDGRIKPDVAAQGRDVFGARLGGYTATLHGTSFSSPLVAGVAAQMLEANPNLKPLEIREILRQSGHQHQEPDIRLGWGIIDAGLALSVALGHEIPVAWEFSRPYPNPARDFVVFPIAAKRNNERLSISIYDVLGRRAATVFEGHVSPGSHEIAFSVDNLSPGVYVYRIAGTNAAETGTMVVVR